jgi:hypothetical protein
MPAPVPRCQSISVIGNTIRPSFGDFFFVAPAKSGGRRLPWMPAFAGMTETEWNQYQILTPSCAAPASAVAPPGSAKRNV